VEYLLKKDNFLIIERGWLEGYYGTLFYKFNYISENLSIEPQNFSGRHKGLTMAILVFCLKPQFKVLAKFDKRFEYTETGHCKNYYYKARKELV
jgi:hypothetical protein